MLYEVITIGVVFHSERVVDLRLHLLIQNIHRFDRKDFHLTKFTYFHKKITAAWIN